MVINHEITIFDFSRFLFATLTFWVVKPVMGLMDPYTQQRGAASLHVTGSKGPTQDVKGCKKKTGVTPLVGRMHRYTSEERGFFKCYWV